MAAPGRNIHIRLANEDAHRFDELAREFSGLQKGTVLRMLISAQLRKSLAENIELIDSQIRKPGGSRAKNIVGVNSKNRIG